MFSPSTPIIASVIDELRFCSFVNTPSMTFTVVNGMVVPLPSELASLFSRSTPLYVPLGLEYLIDRPVCLAQTPGEIEAFKEWTCFLRS